LAHEFGPEVVEVFTDRFLSVEEVCVHFLLCPKQDTSILENAAPKKRTVNPQLVAQMKERRRTKIEGILKKAKKMLQSNILDGIQDKQLFNPEAASKQNWKTREVPSKGKGKFLHITDIHLDPLYKAGTNTKCDTPLCCREEYGAGNAGIWGDYACDLPLSTLHHMLQFIAINFSLDFILWTGDNPPHDIWQESRAGQLARTAALTQILHTYFPNTPIFPAIGNHESFPVDQFPTAPRNAWLMDALAADWAGWLPPSALTSLRQGGYYTTLIRPGLRLISLNTQYCDINNFWLVLNDTDPTGQLEWLRAVLTNATRAGETVVIIGHIPPGDTTCLYGYAGRYLAIYREFATIIRAQFYGHTHLDSFALLYKTEGAPGVAEGVVYVAPSATTYTQINPSFRIYDYDRASTTVLDYHQYHADISLANKQGEPKWELFYSALSEYNLSSLAPVQWQALTQRLKTDDALFQKFYKNMYTGYSLLDPCTGECKKNSLCELVSQTSKDFIECTGMEYNLASLWDWLMNHLC
jgi:sphingomyelin phosphodiesterase